MKLVLYITMFTFSSSFLLAQNDNTNKRLFFNKGAALDVIVSTPFSNTSELINRYKETAFPVAFEYSYELRPSFEIGDLILGNHKPKHLIFGKWSNLEKRLAFLDVIVTRVPDFHEQRQSIFNEFRMTYYEAEKDIDVIIDTHVYNVVTCFWQKDTGTRKAFFKRWKQKVLEHQGKLLLTLENGASPLGYRYNPDILTIVQWESRKHFDRFLKENPLTAYTYLEDVHQFSIKK